MYFMNPSSYPLISIVIPVFNTDVGKMEHMIKSVKEQKCNCQYEIIIVDDGSDIETASYLDSLRIDNLKPIIHQSNKGLAGARNTGIKKSTGQYIIFLDADDLLKDNTIDSMSQYISEYHPDAIYGRMVLYKSDNNRIMKLTEYNCNGNDLIFLKKTMKQNQNGIFFYDKNEEIEKVKLRLLDFSSDRDYIILGSACSVVYKRDIIEKYGFDEKVTICEDQVFNRQFLQHISNCLIVPDEWYCYVMYESSMLHNQGKAVDISKTYSYWNALAELDTNESKYLQSVSNAHNISLLCDDIRNIALSGERFIPSIKKISKLSNHKIINKAKHEKCISGSKVEHIKCILIKYDMLLPLWMAYKFRAVIKRA